MFDYLAIEALSTVIALQSFEKTAKRLHITQSAVSQRIKNLEKRHGEPLVIRSLPYKATPLGEKLIAHHKRVTLLEESFNDQIEQTSKPHFSIAINRDSIETWFLDVIESTSLFNEISLDIIADDHELTLDYLRKGIVRACLSTASKPILGANAAFIGNMEYLCTASPAFIKHYFPKGMTKENLSTAPFIKFDKNDMLHERYIEKHFGMDASTVNYHTVPSVACIRQYALSGYGYALIPRIDISKELASGKLVQIPKSKSWDIPLYWHHWEIDSPRYKAFNLEIIRKASKALIKT